MIRGGGEIHDETAAAPQGLRQFPAEGPRLRLETLEERGSDLASRERAVDVEHREARPPGSHEQGGLSPGPILWHLQPKRIVARPGEGADADRDPAEPVRPALPPKHPARPVGGHVRADLDLRAGETAGREHALAVGR